MKWGNININDLRFGDKNIVRAYYGTHIVFDKLEGYHNNHKWVDLGLPSGLLWATMNIGATNTHDYGDYFSWGETRPKNTYTPENTPTYGAIMPSDNISGQPRLDAARANWGGGWRMPTKEEMEELDRYCTAEFVDINIGQEFTDNFIKICKIIGYNGVEIFLPLGGYKDGDIVIESSNTNVIEAKGHYWSASPYIDDDYTLHYAYDLNAMKGIEQGDNLYIPYSARYYGHNIRAVLDRSSLNQ